MTLDEAIKHCLETSNCRKTRPKCRAEHAQLAAWLKELKALRLKRDSAETQENHDLKPCPFCGGNEIITRLQCVGSDSYYQQIKFTVICTTCHAGRDEICGFELHKTDFDKIESCINNIKENWNRRAENAN